MKLLCCLIMRVVDHHTEKCEFFLANVQESLLFFEEQIEREPTHVLGRPSWPSCGRWIEEIIRKVTITVTHLRDNKDLTRAMRQWIKEEDKEDFMTYWMLQVTEE